MTTLRATSMPGVCVGHVWVWVCCCAYGGGARELGPLSCRLLSARCGAPRRPTRQVLPRVGLCVAQRLCLCDYGREGLAGPVGVEDVGQGTREDALREGGVRRVVDFQMGDSQSWAGQRRACPAARATPPHTPRSSQPCPRCPRDRAAWTAPGGPRPQRPPPGTGRPRPWLGGCRAAGGGGRLTRAGLAVAVRPGPGAARAARNNAKRAARRAAHRAAASVSV